MFCQTYENMYIMCSNTNGVVNYAPLCIHSFRLVAPHKILEAQIYNSGYHSYEEIDNIQDRLRWCRYHLGLKQREVATEIGISRASYIKLETGTSDHVGKDTVDRLSALYNVPPEDLLDSYNLFLFKGQGQQIRQYRKEHKLGKKPLARLLGTTSKCIQDWENERKTMSRESWEKYWKGKI